MTDIADDIKELRAEFAKVDLKDKEAVQKWFADHSYLTKSDHAIIADRSLLWISELHKFAGDIIPRSIKPPGWIRPKKVVNIEVPDPWDNAEWLDRMVQIHSTYILANAIGVSRTTLRRKLKRHKIEKPDHAKSKNPCCTHAWCFEHYVTKNLTQTKCAELAGIGRRAFANWLVRFKIPARSANDCHVSSPKLFWVQKLVHQLRKQEVVNKIFLREDHIHVRFKNFFWESYYYNVPKKRITHSFHITKEQSQLENVPIAKFEFESSLSGENEYPAHIALPRKEFDKASFMEQRIALHDLCRTIVRRGWVPMDYPDEVLQADWRRVLKTKEARFLRNSRFYATVTQRHLQAAGWYIAEHFFPFDEFTDTMKSPRLVTRALNDLSRRPTKINTHNILKAVAGDAKAQNRPRLRVVDPRMYIAIMRRLGIKGKVLDVYPNHGYRMMACAALGLTYVAPRSDKVQAAIDKGLLEFLGLDFEWFDGQSLDLVLHDDDLAEHPLGDITPYTNLTKRLLHFVHRSNRKNLEAKTRPESIIQIQSFYRRTPDYFFLF